MYMHEYICIYPCQIIGTRTLIFILLFEKEKKKKTIKRSKPTLRLKKEKIPKEIGIQKYQSPSEYMRNNPKILQSFSKL